MSVYSQVGINTSNPKASLDVAAKPADLKMPDGLIAPRLTGDELYTKNAIYGADQTGAIVYVTAVPAVANQINDTTDIKTSGYYYHNGTKWVKLEGSPGDPTVDAFVDDPGNNMVKLGATSKGMLRSFQTDFVIKDNGNVGIGNNDPTVKLDVSGNARFRNVPRISNISTLDDIMILGYDGTVRKVDPKVILDLNDVKVLTYSRVNSSPISASTPAETEVTIGSLSIRYNGVASGSIEAGYIEYKLTAPQHVTIWYKKAGSGGVGLDTWGTRASSSSTWYKLVGGTANDINISPANRDVSETHIILHNTNEVYRITTNLNGAIAASGTVPAVQSSVTLFVEKLD